MPFCLDFDVLVIAKIRDKLLGSVGEGLALFGCVDAVESDAFSASLVHDSDCVTVMNAYDLPVKSSAVARVAQKSSNTKIAENRRMAKSQSCVIFGSSLL